MTERIKRETSSSLIEAMESDKKTVQEEAPVEFISSGSTVFNLAASGKGRKGGWARARVLNAVGDGSSGKTLMALEFAFSCFKTIRKRKSKLFPKVKKLKIIYNNVEGVMDFPIESMYGKAFVDFVEWKKADVVEDFGNDFFANVKPITDGECLIYIVDSWDALDSRDERAAFDASIDKNTPLEGSYDLGKQKYASKRFFKKVCTEMENKDVTLFIVSQTRTKIGITFGKKKYRAGGDALNFYTHQVAWLYEKGKLVRQSQGHQRVYGINTLAKLERNKTAKPFREAEFSILFDHGIDDVGSMVDWYYGPKAKSFQLQKDDKPYKVREAFIKYVEDNDYEEKLQIMVEEKWAAIEATIKSNRKRKF